MARGLCVSSSASLGLAGSEATSHPPKVHVYSRHPAENGKSNVSNCYVEGFHPPNIHIKSSKNDKEMDGVEMSDLSFNDDWTFQRLVHVPFTPNGNDRYECHVEHSALQTPKKVRWDPDN